MAEANRTQEKSTRKTHTDNKQTTKTSTQQKHQTTTQQRQRTTKIVQNSNMIKHESKHNKTELAHTTKTDKSKHNATTATTI